jgi:hypothetical protein
VKCSPAVSFESRETADQLLVEVAHLEVRDGVGVQVDLGELRHHEVEQVRALHPRDLRVEAELVDHVARGRREAGDVRPEVAGDVGRVVQHAAEVERARVVDPSDTGDRLEYRLDVVDDALQRRVPREHFRLRRLEHAVQPAQDDERQDHPPVLGLLVDAAELVGDRPDEARVRA